jgi:predicted alpha-1,6-mannanase (GH76 family)
MTVWVRPARYIMNGWLSGDRWITCDVMAAFAKLLQNQRDSLGKKVVIAVTNSHWIGAVIAVPTKTVYVIDGFRRAQDHACLIRQVLEFFKEKNVGTQARTRKEF